MWDIVPGARPVNASNLMAESSLDSGGLRYMGKASEWTLETKISDTLSGANRSVALIKASRCLESS